MGWPRVHPGQRVQVIAASGESCLHLRSAGRRASTAYTGGRIKSAPARAFTIHIIYMPWQMREFSVLLVVSAMGCGLIAAAEAPAAAPNQPPATSKDDTVENYWGAKVADPYRWLEFADAPAVKQWIEAQNAYTERVLSGFPQGAAIAKRVQALSLTSTARSQPELVAGRLFFLQQTPPQPQPVLVFQNWPKGEVKVLVDPNPDARCRHHRVLALTRWAVGCLRHRRGGKRGDDAPRG